jgi:hypothetical protein
VDRTPELKRDAEGNPKVWGSGEVPPPFFHKMKSYNGTPKCDRHFLEEAEVGTEVPVQN